MRLMLPFNAVTQHSIATLGSSGSESIVCISTVLLIVTPCCCFAPRSHGGAALASSMPCVCGHRNAWPPAVGAQRSADHGCTCDIHGDASLPRPFGSCTGSVESTVATYLVACTCDLGAKQQQGTVATYQSCGTAKVFWVAEKSGLPAGTWWPGATRAWVAGTEPGVTARNLLVAWRGSRRCSACAVLACTEAVLAPCASRHGIGLRLASYV